MHNSVLTVIIAIPHPRYTRAMQAILHRAVQVLPVRVQGLVYWRLLELLRAAPRFVVLGSEE